jgi:beta-alanine--pyruvate transaminase
MNKPVSPTTFEPTPNNLEPFWMGFTPNRAFKQKPRLIARAKDMHYYDLKGRAILDGSVRVSGAPTPAIAAIRS